MPIGRLLAAPALLALLPSVVAAQSLQCDPGDPICYPDGHGGYGGGTSGGPAIPPSSGEPGGGTIGQRNGGGQTNDTGVVCETHTGNFCQTGASGRQVCTWKTWTECHEAPGTTPGGTSSGAGSTSGGGTTASSPGDDENAPQIRPSACRNAVCCTASGFTWRADIKHATPQGTCLSQWEIAEFCDDLNACEAARTNCEEQIGPSIFDCYKTEADAAGYACGYRYTPDRGRVILEGGSFGWYFGDDNRLRSGLRFGAHQLCQASDERVRVLQYHDETSPTQCSFRCMENRAAGTYGAARTNIAAGFSFDYGGFGLGLEFSRDVPGYQATTKGYIERCDSRYDPLTQLCANDYETCIAAREALCKNTPR